MTDEIDRLASEVSEVSDTAAAAKTLIAGLVEQVRLAASDRSKLDELILKLDAAQQDLANAVAENTPAPPPDPVPAPEPTPEPVPEPAPEPTPPADGSAPTG
jgi:uncharacterized coiled-coil protein SlyX